MNHGIETPARWPSLFAECKLADELYGSDGVTRVADWLAFQVARIDDADFAAKFGGYINLPGTVHRDYNHRHIRSSRGDLLGGIRFRRMDTTRPFVEVMSHSFTDLAELTDCVNAEWAAFSPRYARLYGPPGTLTAPGARLDQAVHAARCADMTPPDNRVTLAPFSAPDDAVALVNERYAALAAEDPELARRISAQSAEDLHSLHAAGQLHAITVDDVVVGAIAVAPNEPDQGARWLAGYEIHEEVIAAGHRGKGYAASAQAAWAHSHALKHARKHALESADTPAPVMVGTIHRINTASRKTAERAGRPRVLDAVFLPLGAAAP